MDGFKLALNKTTVAAGVTRTAVIALNSAKNMLIGFGIGMAIQLLTTGISKLVTAQQDAIDKANELTDTYKSCSAEITDNVSSLEKMDDELTRLAKGVDENGKNVKLTADKYARYRDIISEVVDMNPSLIKGYNDEGQELVNNNTLIQDAIDLQRELNRLKMDEYLNSGKDILKGSRGESNQARQEIGSIVSGSLTKPALGDQLTGGHEWFGMADTNKASAVLEQFGLTLNDIMLGNIDSLEVLVQKRREIISSLEQEGILDKTKAQELNTQIGLIDIQLSKMDAASQKTSKYLSFWAANDEGNKSWYNEIDTGYLDDFSTSLNTIASDGSMSISEMQVKVMELGESFAGMQDQIPTKAFEDLQTQFANGAISEEEYYTALTSLLEQLDKLKEKYPELADAINSVGAAWRGSVGSTDTSSSPLLYTSQELSKALTDTEKALSSLSVAYEEQDKNGSISSATLATLIAEHENWMELVTIENGIIRLNSDAVIDNAKTKIQAKIDEIQALIDTAKVARNNAISQVSSLKVIAEAYKIAAKAATTYGAAVGNSNAAVDAESQIKALEVEIANMDTGIGQNKTIVDALKQSLDNLNSNDPFGNMADSISKANEESQKLLEYQLKAEGDAAIRVIDRKIKAIQDAQKASEKAIDEEIDGIKKEKEAYEKAIDAEIDKLNERKKALEDSIDEYESAAGAVKDLIDEQMDAIDKRKDEVNEFYDEQLDALDKTNEALQDQIDREKALEALEKAKSQKVMVFKDGEFDYLENEGAVKDAQDNYDQVLADQALQAEKDRLQEERDAKLEALDAEKKLLEDYKKLWEDATTAYEREQQELINIKVFGKDWEQAILEQRTDILHKFTEEQYNQTVELEENVLTQLEILTKQKEDEAILFEERIAQKELEREQEAADYAARIETLNGYKDQVQEGLNLVGQSWEEYQDTLKYEAKWEAALLDGMAEKAWEYAESVKAAIRSAQDAIEDGNTSGGSGKSPDSSSKDKSLAQAKKEYSDAVTQHAPQSVLDRYKDKIDNLQKLSTGGVVTEPGLFITDEDGAEAKVRPKAGKATLLDKGDMVFPHGAFPTDPFSLMMRVAAENFMIPGRIQEFGDSVGKVINNTTVNQKEEVQLHFHGDMSFPNITDPNDSKRLVRALLDMGRESYQLNSDGGML